jgi:circadian clock protein KaiC
MNLALSGIIGLDKVLNGGFPLGSTMIVEGEPGTGKTTLGVQFLYNGAIQYREAGIYITFEELPDQIYKDMLKFGWDLRALERQNLLRVVCISPKLFLDQFLEPSGVIEQLIQQIQCKRLVIDSISLFRYGLSEDEYHRSMFYSLRNMLRKHAITSLLLQELKRSNSEQATFENYVVDGVIQLSLKSHLEKYRKRTIEIIKMRATKFAEGEHHYRINDEGFYVIPRLTMVEDKSVLQDGYITTGIAQLDRVLEGGIPTSSSFLLDTNSKAYYKYIVTSIMAAQIKAGRIVTYMCSNVDSLNELGMLLKMFEIDIFAEMIAGRFFIIEHYDRPYPPEFASAVIDVNAIDNEHYQETLDKRLLHTFHESIASKLHWFVFVDLNTIFSHRGSDFVYRFYDGELARARAFGMTILALCNFSEISHEAASYFERTSNGVIRTWVDSGYQFIQLTKSPHGVVSEPHLIERIDTVPYVRMI